MEHSLSLQGEVRASDFLMGLPLPRGWRRFVGGDQLGLPIDFLLEATPGAPLVVSLHGFTDRARYSYPRFERRRSFRDAGFSVLYIADPTLTLSDEIELGWYLGAPRVDAAGALVELIEAAMARLRAPNVLLVGSSGGGFAALRLAALREDWRALVFSPQTSVARYYRNVVAKLERVGFPAFGDLVTDRSFGGRLGLEESFRSPRGGSILYIQNLDDPFHVENHFAPFAAMNPLGVAFVLEEHGDGHRPPSVERVCDWVARSLG